jgi:hypothetical protein
MVRSLIDEVSWICSSAALATLTVTHFIAAVSPSAQKLEISSPPSRGRCNYAAVCELLIFPPTIMNDSIALSL